MDNKTLVNEPVGFAFWQILVAVPLCFFLRGFTSGPLFQVLPGRYFFIFWMMQRFAIRASGRKLNFMVYVLAPTLIAFLSEKIFSSIILTPGSLYFYSFVTVYLVAALQKRVEKRSWIFVSIVGLLTFFFSFVFSNITMQEGVSQTIRFMQTGRLQSESNFSAAAVADAFALITCMVGFMLLCKRPRPKADQAL